MKLLRGGRLYGSCEPSTRRSRWSLLLGR